MDCHVSFLDLALGALRSSDKRNFLFLPLFLLEGGLLIAHASFSDLPQHLFWLRAALVAVMMVMGLFFLNRDFFFPFLSKANRLWRRNSRLPANLSFTIKVGEDTYPLVMEDCSATGMCISGSYENLGKHFTRSRGELISIQGGYRTYKNVISGRFPGSAEKEILFGSDCRCLTPNLCKN